MNQKFPNLLSPFQIGKLQLKNRMCVSPMGLFYNEVLGPFGEYTNQAIEYVSQRAKGGFGLMFLGTNFLADTKVDVQDTTFHFMSHPDKFQTAASELNERADMFGMKMIQQLSLGFGRIYEDCYAPSAVDVWGAPGVKAKVMTTEQVRMKIDQVIEASKLMKASGFQGVEMHAMHWGYLLDQFATAITNQREDEYGGSLENRLRVAKELVQGIKQENGDDFVVSMRFALKSYIKGLNQSDYTGEHEAGRTLEEAIQIAKMLESYGYDCLNCDVGWYDSYYYQFPPTYMPKGYVIPLAAEVKKAVNIPVLCGSRMQDPVMCEQALADGKIDAVVLGRPSIADPDYAQKISMGVPEQIRPCIGCNVGCEWRILNGKYDECAVNPLMNKELTYSPQKALNPKRIAIIGGGIAGMEIARTATMRGHECTIYEKDGVLGGNLIAAGTHSFKQENMRLVEWYRNEMKQWRVKVEYHCEMTTEKIKALHPDVVVLAIGSVPVMPRSIEGIDHPKCSSGVDAALGNVAIGDKVVVVGGGLVGCEEAMDHAMKGRDVTIVEAADDVLAASEMIHPAYTMMVHDLIEHYGIKVVASHKIVAINDEGAQVEPTAGGEAFTIPADNVIMSIGMRPRASFATELQGTGIEVYEVGDGRKVGNVYTSINGAYAVARML